MTVLHKQKRFTIQTEDVEREYIENLIGEYFDSFSIIETTGYWRGEQERSIVIEIITHAHYRELVRRLAMDIRIHNKQEAVLFCESPIDYAALV